MRSGDGLGLAAEDDLDGLRVVARRKDGGDPCEQVSRKIDIVGRACLLVVKMRVRTQIRAVARRAALEIDGADQVTLDQVSRQL